MEGKEGSRVAVGDQKMEGAAGAAVRAARRPRGSTFRVVMRVVPDGGRALAKAREYVIARLVADILADLGGAGPCGR